MDTSVVAPEEKFSDTKTMGLLLLRDVFQAVSPKTWAANTTSCGALALGGPKRLMSSWTEVNG